MTASKTALKRHLNNVRGRRQIDVETGSKMQMESTSKKVYKSA